ncbi:MAG: DsbA family protein [Chloroflexi bacterium]|nr:DsbA family protein [Chloroflexota bacterium]MBK6709467.1 DsbA family protein [Chloroflexota bacterium]MBK7178601.1 DsbA family protein [Chloroflexota bacterium]MBK7915238.1 DsbA family protein [Chloroflexota bacterium]MBK8935575.1 DsbA family protein [Chloroflexota bacterium]
MATRSRNKRNAQKDERKTNWAIIGGIIGLGVVGLFGLLFASLQGTGAPTAVPTPTRSLVLEDYCAANPANCVATGAADAALTVVEVSDYGCGHCANFNLNSADILRAQYVESGQVRWITIPYALGGQNGYPTLPSAASALCANEQGAFEPYHKALFGIQQTADFNTRDGFLKIAGNLGLDTTAFAACYDDGRYESTVSANIQAANRSGISATPTFFINGQKVEGNLPIANFQQLLDSELGS